MYITFSCPGSTPEEGKRFEMSQLSSNSVRTITTLIELVVTYLVSEIPQQDPVAKMRIQLPGERPSLLEANYVKDDLGYDIEDGSEELSFQSWSKLVTLLSEMIEGRRTEFKTYTGASDDARMLKWSIRPAPDNPDAD